MAHIAPIQARIEFDVSVVEAQMALLKALIEGHRWTGTVPAALLEEISGDLDRLCSNLVLGAPIATAYSPESIGVRFRPRLGVEFERFLAALRTSESHPNRPR